MSHENAQDSPEARDSKPTKRKASPAQAAAGRELETVQSIARRQAEHAARHQEFYRDRRRADGD